MKLTRINVIHAALLSYFCSAIDAQAITINPCYGCEAVNFEPRMTISALWHGLFPDGRELIALETVSFKITEGIVTQSDSVPVGTLLEDITPGFVDVAGENYIWFTIADTRVGIDVNWNTYDNRIFFYAGGTLVSHPLNLRGLTGIFYTRPGTFDTSPLRLTMYFQHDPTKVPVPPMAAALGLSVLGLFSIRRGSVAQNP